MSHFITSLDDFPTIAALERVKDSIQEEIERRKECLESGDCWYCHHTLANHTCRYAKPEVKT